MVRITEELVRKKAEHNESEICTLEELSLHQEDVEKIEHLGNWCRDLQILLLQNNLISKIENLNKLKKLKYLNLALNNIEKIENLERLESLEKLDLTLNFIGDLESVCNLQNNYNLKELYLTGNPCTDYKGYRTYVVAKLPQLKHLDSSDVLRSEQLKANRDLNDVLPQIIEQQNVYMRQREEQRRRMSNRNKDISDEDFWKETTEHAPEIRIEMAERSRRNKKDEDKKEEEVKPLKLFADDGRPLNLNKPKIPFTINYDDQKEIILDIAVYRYLDTSLIDVDLQPNYVRVTIKGKILQICLNEEICIDKSTCQRSQITGHLVITMPKLNYKPRRYEKVNREDIPKIDISDNEKRQRREYLEIGGDKLSELCDITRKKEPNFVDNPEVPPLE